MNRRVSVEDRRRLLARRHRLDGDAAGPEEVVASVVALHATDPASIYLSVLARSRLTDIAEVGAALYDRRSLVRWMGMRRTLFVVGRRDIPMVQAASSATVAAGLRRQLIGRLERNGTEPSIDDDLDSWLTGLGEEVDEAVQKRGTATGAELSRDVPALRTVIPARTRSERRQHVTSPLLTILGCEGRLVRGAPTGPWTSRHHRWEPVSTWWPEGLPTAEPEEARRDLACRWLARFGPATSDDLQWWTGWNVTTTRRVLATLDTEEVDLHGRPGVVLRSEPDEAGADQPVAALLPALDPTPMGWKHREWFLGIDRDHLYDRAGNIGPTVWWDGEVIGGWATGPAGELRISILADRGAEARAAVDAAAERLHRRLEGAVIIPAARTPLERSLAS